MKNTYQLIFSFLVLCSTSFGQIIYVHADATGANDGSSWANAFTNLQSALPLATPSNQIWVAEGTYKPDASNRSIAFSLLTGTNLYGGFNGTETLLSQRNPTLNVTTLSGDLLGNDNSNIIHSESTRQDNSYNIIKIQAAAVNVTVDGFTISGANGNGAPGITYSGAVVLSAGLSTSITTFFENVIFENNTAVEAAVFRGFTPAANGSNAIVEFNVTNSIIRNNASQTMAPCEFVGTHVNSWGQNSYDRVSGSFKNTLFHDNSSVNAASCINNRVNGGSGNYSPLSVFNCTFTENNGSGGLVVNMLRATTSKYVNLIIYNNGSNSPISMSNSGPVAISWINCIVNDPIFGLNQDPLFRDAANKDYRLDCSGNSPAIDGGTLTGITLPPLDLAGNSRVVNTVDMGCYEYRSVITVTPTNPTVCSGSSVTFNSENGIGIVWSNGIVEGVPYYPVATETVTISGSNDNNCSQVIPITITVPEIADPEVNATPTSICTGGNSTVSISNSESDVYYSLVNDATDEVVFGPIQGNGGNLDFELTGIMTSVTYHVQARKYEQTNNRSLDLDGVNDYISLGTNNRGLANLITISARVRASLTGANQWVASKYNSTNNGFLLYIDANGKARFDGRDGAGGYKTSGVSTTIVADNEWHEITGVVRSTGWEIYVDGVLENSGSYGLGGGGLGTVTEFRLGSFSTTYSPIEIDQLAVWNTDLASSLILANVNTCLQGNESNMIAFFPFNEGTGTVATDLSPVAINGVLTNMSAPACWITGPIDACSDFCELELSDLVTINVNNPAQPTITAGGSTSICSGGSVTLTSSPGTTYLWSTGETTASIVVSTAGTYTVQVGNGAGCLSPLSNGTTVTVGTPPSQPSVSADGPTTFCAGGSVTLTSSPGTSYLWSTGETTASISPSTSGTFSVQVADAAGCFSTASNGITVTIHNIPAQPTITAGGPTTFCTGGSVMLTASSGSTYLWSNGATSSSINVTTAGTYTVQVSNAQGCQSIASAGTTVTVNALPTQPSISAGGSTTFCEGGSVTLTSSAGNSYLWSNGATSASINVTTTGSYTVQVTNAAGCQSISSAATLVTVNSLPAQPTVTTGGPTTFCAGGSVTLTSSAGTAYLWSNGATTASIAVTTSGTYTVQVTNAAGCQSTASAGTVVTVNSIPAQPSISAGGPTTFCSGGSVTLTSSAGTNYLWSDGSMSASINPSSSGTYTVQVTNAAGCQSIASVPLTVTVNSSPNAPIITPDGPTTFCAGETVNLASSPGTTYLWSNGSTASSVNVSSSNTYTVQITDINGCLSPSSTPITVTVNAQPVITQGTVNNPISCTVDNGSIEVNGSGTGTLSWSGTSGGSQVVTTFPSTILNLGDGAYSITFTDATTCVSNLLNVSLSAPSAPPAPSITASGATTFCSGESVTLTASPGNSYLWSTGETTSSIVVSIANDYTVSITDASGCSSPSSSATTVTVNPLPNITEGTLVHPTSCITDNGSIEVNGNGNGDLSWTGASNGSMSAVSLPVTVSGLGEGVYNFTFTDANGCESQILSAMLSAPNTPATPVITADGPTTFCEGDHVELTSSAADNYLWSTGETTQSITVDAAGTYTLTVSNADGCVSPVSAGTTVVVNSIPIASTSLTGITITASPAGANYQWIDCNNMNEEINGAQSQVFTPTANGSYAVIVTENGCADTSECVSITSVGLIEIDSKFELNLHPNPSSDKVKVICSNDVNEVLIFSTTGELVQKEEAVEFSVSTLSTGVYLVKVVTNNGTGNIRLIKQ